MKKRIKLSGHEYKTQQLFKEHALEKQRGSFLKFIASGSQEDSTGIRNDHANDNEGVYVASNVLEEAGSLAVTSSSDEGQQGVMANDQQ